MSNSAKKSDIRKKDFYIIRDEKSQNIVTVVFPNGIQVGLNEPDFNSGIVLSNLSTPPASTTNSLYAVGGTVYFDGTPLGAGGGGAPVNAQYLTLALNGTLTQERLLVAGNGLALTDGGAGGNATLAVGAGSYITVAADTVAVNLSTLTPAIAGDGLTGTGSTLAVGAGTDITVATNTVGVDRSTLATAFAGYGLADGGSTLNVGAGNGISVAANSVAVLPEPTSGTIAASSTGTSVIVEATNLILAMQIFS